MNGRSDSDGLTTSRTFDYANRILTQSTAPTAGGASLASFSLTYDSVGNVTQDVQSVSGYTTSGSARDTGTWQYTPDALNRVKTTTDPGGNTTAYTYDGAGNRTSVQVNSGTPVTTTYDSGSGFPVSASDGTAYTTDHVGELTKVTKGSTSTTYTFDSWGRMSSAGGETYTYDPLDRTITGSGTTAVSYVYSGNSPGPAKVTQAGTTTNFAWDQGGRSPRRSPETACGTS